MLCVEYLYLEVNSGFCSLGWCCRVCICLRLVYALRFYFCAFIHVSLWVIKDAHVMV